MIRPCVRRLLSVCLLLLTVFNPAVLRAEDDPAGKPIAVFVERWVRHVDDLAENAAGRFTSFYMVARHGREVRYLTYRQRSASAGLGVPEYSIGSFSYDHFPYARLVRRGDDISGYCSPNGKTWYLIHHYHKTMPETVYVGIICSGARSAGKAMVFREVTLNGKPFSDYHQADPTAPNEKGKLTINDGTFRYDPAQIGKAARYDVGPFVYREVKGDFDLSARIPRTDKTYRVYARLICRSSVEKDAEAVGIVRDPFNVRMAYDIPGVTRYESLANFSLSRKGLYTKMPGQDKATTDIRWTGSTERWADVVALAEQCATGLRSDIAKLDTFPDAPATKAVEATPEQAMKLKMARSMTCTMVPRNLVQASRLIDQVLDESSTCADAHFAAARVSSALALTELYGAFSRRRAYLALPLGHLLMARNLAEPTTTAQRIDQALVMLACGYPRDMMQWIDAIDKAETDCPEVRALRMFATRDHRRFDPKTILEATGLEQVAWMWATQECDREDLYKPVIRSLSMKKFVPGMFPVYGYHSVGTGHLVCRPAASLAVAHDLVLLTTHPDLPEDLRLGAARQAAEAVDVPAGAQVDLGQVVGMIVQYPETPPELLKALNLLYRRAMDVPVSPRRQDDRLTWRSLPVADFAENQKGLCLRLHVQEAAFTAWQYSVTEDAIDYFNNLATGFEKDKDWPLLMRACAQMAGRGIQVTEPMKHFVQSSAGADVATLKAMGSWFNLERAIPKKPSATYLRSGGAWTSGVAASVSATTSNRYVGVGAMVSAFEADPWNRDAAVAADWLTHNGGTPQDILERMPYSYRLYNEALRRAIMHGHDDKAQAYYTRLTTTWPHLVDPYSRMVDHLALLGRRKDAIDVVRKATKHCDETLCLYNMQAQAALWLIREGQPGEAYEMAGTAAVSFSSQGLLSLAVAQRAHKQFEEAEKTYRTRAGRYASDAGDLMEFMMSRGADDKKLLDQLDRLLDEHPNSRPRVLEHAAEGWSHGGGRPALLESHLDGRFALLPKIEQHRAMMANALAARDQTRFFKYCWHPVLESKRWYTEDVMKVHMMLRLFGRKDRLKDLEPRTRRPYHLYAPHADYLLGKIDAEALLKRSRTNLQRQYAHLLVGVDAERAGKTDEAIKHYRAASDAHKQIHNWIDHWVSAVQKKKAP